MRSHPRKNADTADVLDAYHRAIGRHRGRTGEYFPIVRLNCVGFDGSIRSTDVFRPEKLARWKVRKSGRIAIELMGTTR